MKINKVSDLKVAKKAIKPNEANKGLKTNKINTKTSTKSSKPKITKSIQKQLTKVKNIIQNENKTESKDNDNNVPIMDKDLAKLEKKKAKKSQKKLKKAEAKAHKEKIKTNKRISENQNLIKEINRESTTIETTGSKNTKRDPALASATIFVGNLPINTKRVQLIRLFKEYGEVVSIRLRTASGKNLFKHKIRKEAGSLIAFVQLNSSEAAKKSLSLNGTEFKSNHLRVTLSNEKSTTKEDGSSNFDMKRTIFVGNLKYSATEEKLREIFSSCGEIEYVRCLQDGEKGCKGVAYVCFKTPDSVSLALELNETVLDERPIHVERYSVKKLGAKQKRDGEGTEKKLKKNTGPFKRLQQKKSTRPQQKGETEGFDDEAQKKKKKQFLGVKVNSLPKKNKKKMNDQMKRLAAKIAPKAKPDSIGKLFE